MKLQQSGFIFAALFLCMSGEMQGTRNWAAGGRPTTAPVATMRKVPLVSKLNLEQVRHHEGYSSDEEEEQETPQNSPISSPRRYGASDSDTPRSGGETERYREEPQVPRLNLGGAQGSSYGLPARRKEEERPRPMLGARQVSPQILKWANEYSEQIAKFYKQLPLKLDHIDWNDVDAAIKKLTFPHPAGATKDAEGMDYPRTVSSYDQQYILKQINDMYHADSVARFVELSAWAKHFVPRIAEYFQQPSLIPVTEVKWSDVMDAAKELNINFPRNLSTEERDYIFGMVNGLLSEAEGGQFPEEDRSSVGKMVNVAQVVQKAQLKEQTRKVHKLLEVAENVSRRSAIAADEKLLKDEYFMAKISELQLKTHRSISLDLVLDSISQLNMSRYTKKMISDRIKSNWNQEFLEKIRADVAKYRLRTKTQLSKILDLTLHIQNSFKRDIRNALNAQSNALDAQARSLMNTPFFKRVATYIEQNKVRLNSFDILDKVMFAVYAPGKERSQWTKEVKRLSQQDKASMLRTYSDALRLSRPSEDDILQDSAGVREDVLGKVQLLDKQVADIFASVEKSYEYLHSNKKSSKQMLLDKIQHQVKQADKAFATAMKLSRKSGSDEVARVAQRIAGNVSDLHRLASQAQAFVHQQLPKADDNGIKDAGSSALEDFLGKSDEDKIKAMQISVADIMVALTPERSGGQAPKILEILSNVRDLLITAYEDKELAQKLATLKLVYHGLSEAIHEGSVTSIQNQQLLELGQVQADLLSLMHDLLANAPQGMRDEEKEVVNDGPQRVDFDEKPAVSKRRMPQPFNRVSSQQPLSPEAKQALAQALLTQKA